mmetsp:Transcript_39894/g.94784  ORF Transcript_39894/g.94784 Transcript_39894/m.94784 type:complete len:418 (+) Transcript_39894:252-1505(+)
MESKNSVDDFFADLLPKKPTKGEAEDDMVLACAPASSSDTAADKQQHNPVRSGQPMRPRDPIDEKALQKALRHMAENLKEVLEGMDKRLTELEGTCERISDSLSEIQERGQEDGKHVKERLGQLETSTREVQRGVQLLRDRQELADAQAELRKFSEAKAVEKDREDPKPADGAPASRSSEHSSKSEGASPAASAPSAPAAPPDPPQLPAPPAPAADPPQQYSQPQAAPAPQQQQQQQHYTPSPPPPPAPPQQQYASCGMQVSGPPPPPQHMPMPPAPASQPPPPPPPPSVPQQQQQQLYQHHHHHQAASQPPQPPQPGPQGPPGRGYASPSYQQQGPGPAIPNPKQHMPQVRPLRPPPARGGPREPSLPSEGGEKGGPWGRERLPCQPDAREPPPPLPLVNPAGGLWARSSRTLPRR